MFPHKINWFNEVTRLLELYSINITEENIASKNHFEWKSIVKRAITSICLAKLNSQKEKLSKGSRIPTYTSLKQRRYFHLLQPQDSRTLFQIRTEVYDIKSFRKYKFGDDKCRLCENGVESMDHITNECVEVRRRNFKRVDNVGEDHNDLQEIISRIRCFESQLEMAA